MNDHIVQIKSLDETSVFIEYYSTYPVNAGVRSSICFRIKLNAIFYSKFYDMKCKILPGRENVRGNGLRYRND